MSGSHNLDIKQILKWPMLVNSKRQWVSSSGTDLNSQNYLKADFDMDVETNPTHSLLDDDSDEEGLLEKFDRVFSKAQSSEKVC